MIDDDCFTYGQATYQALKSVYGDCEDNAEMVDGLMSPMELEPFLIYCQEHLGWPKAAAHFALVAVTRMVDRERTADAEEEGPE